MLKKLEVNDATLANVFLETKTLQEFLANPVFTDDNGFYGLASDVMRFTENLTKVILITSAPCVGSTHRSRMCC